jgi:hypothetical protein
LKQELFDYLEDHKHDIDAAFRQSTAEIVDHTKSLLASLVDKRDKPEVDNMAQESTKKILMLD